MASQKIYEYVEGLSIDIPLTDSRGEEVPIALIADQKLIVLRPGSAEEEDWTATTVAPNIVRHTVPEGADLLPGKYKIQAYIETTDGYKGRCKTVDMTVYRKMK